MKSISNQKSLIYGRGNKSEPNTRLRKLSLLTLLFFIADIGNSTLAQAQIAYTTSSTTKPKFQISYGPETTLDQMIGIELAANVWAEFLADDVTIKLFATTTNQIPQDVLGSATAEMSVPQTSYQTFLSKLSTDQKSPNDATAYTNFQKGGDDDDSGLNVMVGDRVVSNIDYLQSTRANAKALGLLSSNDSGFDGHIVFNKLNDSNIPLKWSYNFTSNLIPSDQLDFLSTVVHEMGHTLGFISGVDNPNLKSAIKNKKTTGKSITDSVLEKSMTPLDLYRFSTQSKDKIVSGDDDSPSTKGIPDLSIGKDPFFTLNRGVSKVEDMATGEDPTLGGDGDQASHWKQDKNAIMEPYLGTGKREAIASTDLIALDLIGWDVRSPALQLDQFAPILPTLYNQAKATAESKIANSSTWILSAPPPLVNPITVDGNNSDDDDDDDDTPPSLSLQDSALTEFCNLLENYNTSECIRWRASGSEKWKQYYEKLGLKQRWQPNPLITSAPKSVPESSATSSLLVLGGLLALRLRKRIVQGKINSPIVKKTR
ncbi:hypothetical protein WA1_10645 [Scytonema hofmannii PCC 7110]|uniref:Peptidase M10 metallopeptidase domain-containing protein n=1 Tax=Scytonema hofmannii PCC 7110 TaxID=128403 RepID=A0A139XFW4_9CYAN|nr:NF038122 family metalloprotease [Scytonema hofmannii]KYC43512.1 hypothetical protein WA1_10645 [Scytonema hofmannii PCC 7110]